MCGIASTVALRDIVSIPAAGLRRLVSRSDGTTLNRAREQKGYSHWKRSQMKRPDGL